MGAILGEWRILFLVVSAVLALRSPAMASETPMTWITLGTQGGPIVTPRRSEPANLLLVDGRPWLVDCGDGAVERLAAAGFQASKVDRVLISHLHMDHIGGLQALIGLRWMQGATGPLIIYGPPGTDQVVQGLVQSMQAVERIKMNGTREPGTAQMVTTMIVEDGASLEVDGVRIRAVRNSHFDDEPGHPAENGTQSLSFRFDYKGYAIGYTGDTGPSEAVAGLEKDVDLLLCEVIDLPGTEATLKSGGSPMPDRLIQPLIRHLETQHLTPRQAGKLAQQAQARHLVFTHLGIAGATQDIAPTLISQARETFGGTISVANDLDKF